MISLNQVKHANKRWFAPDAVKFLGDVEYWILHSHSKKAYLIRSTYAWSDMFSQAKRLHYRINAIDQSTLKVLSLVDNIFDNIQDAKQWLREN